MRAIFNIFRRNRMENDLNRELRYHVDRRVADLVQSGVPVEQARRQAAIEFGGIAQAREEVRETWLWRWLGYSLHDARYACRTLARSPGFAVAAVLSLALGIGANTAIFSILHALLLRSLPVSDPQRLVVVTRNQTVSSPYPLFLALEQQSQTLESVLAFRTTTLRMIENGNSERIAGALVSGSYFETLGVRPVIGTAIAREDDLDWGTGGRRGPVTVLSHSFWTRRFGGERDVIGKRVLLNGSPFTIVGVAPQGFVGAEIGEAPDVFAPMTLQPSLMPSFGDTRVQPLSQWLRILGRLRTGVTVQQAEAELTTLLRRYNSDALQTANIQDSAIRQRISSQRIALLPGGAGISNLRRAYSKPLWMLMAVVALVLLIACANVASLLLSRADARRREIAVRLSLGAARSRLIGQLFMESLVLALTGAASGLLLARWLRDILLQYLPQDNTLAAPIDLTALLFMFVLAAGSALLFGLAPAWQGTKLEVTPALKGGERGSAPARAHLRRGLVVFQISLSFVLVIGAVLFVRSLQNLLAVNTGFAQDNILVASVEADSKLHSRLRQELSRIPGVLSVGMADSGPLGTHTGWTIHVAGYTPKPVEPRDSPSVGFISPGYLQTMDIPLLLGRDFEDRDWQLDRNVMIVNQTFARHFFGADNPIGRKVGNKRGVYDWEIIGVVKDSKYTGLREGSMRMLYVPKRPSLWGTTLAVHLRTAGDPLAIAPALRQKIRELDSTAPVFDVHTVREGIERSLLRERLVGMLTSLFGLLALLLSAIGLYGLIAYGVTRRTREFGIRIAIGANRGSIVKLVVTEAVWLSVFGIVAGAAGSWALSRFIRGILYGIEPTDAASGLAAVAIVFATALVAAWIPARRGASVSPTIALRFE